MNFQDLLRKHIEKSGFLKKEVAQKSGVTPSYITNILSGNFSPPKQDTCEKIADALNLSSAERKELYVAAFKERNADKDVGYKEALGGMAEPSAKYGGLTPIDVPLKRVPVISWVKANAFDDIHDPLPPGTADEWVYTTERGRSMFALKVSNDCMTPEFNEGDVIIIRPDIRPENGKFVVVKDSKANQATFKQYKKYGNNIILHPLNSKYQDIVLDHDDRYQIIGVVVEKVKKY